MIEKKWRRLFRNARKLMQFGLASITPPPNIDLEKHANRLRERLWPQLDVLVEKDYLENTLVTAIVPVRLQPKTVEDDLARIKRIGMTLPRDVFDLLIVDDGSSCIGSMQLKDLAAKISARLVSTNASDVEFSIGRARDLGVNAARTPFVLFHDIDFLMDPASYLRLVDEIRLQDMWHNPFRFLALPGAYLSEEFTHQYLGLFDANRTSEAERLAWAALVRDDRSSVINFTMAISAILVRRSLLLAIGGHDQSFAGHGAEDFELMHRLAQYDPRPPLPSGYCYNLRSNQTRFFVGFRAYFALFGRALFDREICIKHLWHPPRGDVNYFNNENQNRISEYMKRWLD